jgi:hypothetical protein
MLRLRRAHPRARTHSSLHAPRRSARRNGWRRIRFACPERRIGVTAAELRGIKSRSARRCKSRPEARFPLVRGVAPFRSLLRFVAWPLRRLVALSIRHLVASSSCHLVTLSLVALSLVALSLVTSSLCHVVSLSRRLLVAASPGRFVVSTCVAMRGTARNQVSIGHSGRAQCSR